MTPMPESQPDTPRTDAELLAATCAGDMLALQTLFERYRHVMYQTALGITRQPEIAEEVVQDCFYRLYRYAAKLDSSLPLAPWLYRVTVNLCYSRLKRRRRRPWTESFHALAERLKAGPRSTPEHVAEQHELQGIVRATLNQLSPHHRAVLVLHYFHEYSVAEIADILETPEGTVKSRLFYARKLLKAQLEATAAQHLAQLDFT